ncbi:MAG: hypothetical protein AB7V46_03625 [Thermomicrobiales bacterium]
MIENPFGDRARDIQSTVALVVREATEECDSAACPVHFVLEHCAQQAVERLWGSRIKTFVPLLALRDVRGCIQTGSCDHMRSGESVGMVVIAR